MEENAKIEALVNEVVKLEPTKIFRDGKVRMWQRDGFRVLEQNPEKDSKYGKLKQAGNDVFWYIAKAPDGFEEWKLVLNGKVTQKEDVK